MSYNPPELYIISHDYAKQVYANLGFAGISCLTAADQLPGVPCPLITYLSLCT